MESSRKFAITKYVFVPVFVILAILTMHSLDKMRRDAIVTKKIAELKTSCGTAQNRLIEENPGGILNEMIEKPEGKNKKYVLDILGPPCNPQEDPVWFYPRASNDVSHVSYICLFRNDTLVKGLWRKVDSNCKYDLDRCANETEYRGLESALKKYWWQ